MTAQHIYKVIFLAKGEVYEVYARSVAQGEIFGFIQVEGLLFGERSKLVVDPSEETLKTEFKDVRRFQVPLHAVVRIDEVEKQGVSRITPAGKDATSGTLSPFPTSVYSKPDKNPDGKK